MTDNLQHRLAASALISTLERICSSGVLSPEDECDARLLIARSCRAFSIPTIAERVIQVGDHDEERILDLVREEMSAS
jgi:hypothetical protein